MRSSVLLGALLLGLLGPLSCQRSEPARFPHREHLVELECGLPGQPACLDCASCHGSAEQGSGDFTAPSAAACSNCHERPDRALARGRAREQDTAPVIHFTHGPHLEQDVIRGQCVGCHGGLTGERSDASTRPTMDSCLECHRSEFDQARCTGCHPSAQLAELQPETFMIHDETWLRGHGRAAARSETVCRVCHEETTCQDCHDLSQTLPLVARRPEAVFAELPHRSDYVSRHAIEARSQPDSCTTCHTSASCDSCHVARGVSAGRRNATSPHPPGWLGRDERSRAFHGRAARRDLLSCAACHDQGAATNCIECHRPGGPGGTPHPPRWRSSQPLGASPCRYCHG